MRRSFDFMRVLICCEFSGIVRDAFAALGHEAWSCDLLPSERPGKHIVADFRQVIQESWDFIGFHYECRVMANSGARWLYKDGKRWRDDGSENPKDVQRWLELAQAAELFNLTIRDPRPGYAENSVMHEHAKALIDRKQNQTIQPWHHGEPQFKATCLWLRGVDPLKPTKLLVPPVKADEPERHAQWSKVHHASPGPNRWKERSRTLPGIARAMAEQWGQ